MHPKNCRFLQQNYTNSRCKGLDATSSAEKMFPVTESEEKNVVKMELFTHINIYSLF